MRRQPLPIVLVAALIASALALRAARAQPLFEALSEGARQIVDSGDRRAALPPSPIFAGLTQTAALVASSATHATHLRALAMPERGGSNFDAYAAALAYKSAVASPLGAALDAIAARAAPELRAASPDEVSSVASTETVPSGEMATASASPVTGPAALGAQIGAADATDVAPVADATAIVASSAEPLDVAEAATDVLVSAEDLDDPPTADALPLLGFEAAAQAVAQVASSDGARAESADATAAPALPAAIEQIMSDSDAVPAPARPAADGRTVVAAIDAGAVAELEDRQGQSVLARTVERNAARARPAVERKTAKAVAPVRKLTKPKATQPTETAAVPAAVLPPAQEGTPYDTRRPPRGLFQFQ